MLKMREKETSIDRLFFCAGDHVLLFWKDKKHNAQDLNTASYVHFFKQI